MALRIDSCSRIRTVLDLAAKTGPLTDFFSGAAIRFARGSQLRFEFLLKFGNGLADPSLIAAARLRVLSSSDPDSAVGIDKTIGPSYINAGTTEAQWETGEPDMCHLRFELTSSETAEGVFTGTLADPDSEHWFLLTHGSGDAFLYSDIVRSFDAGYTASGTPPLSGTAASLEQVRAYLDAALAQYVKFVGNPAGRKIELTSPVGGKIVQLGADDEGNFSTGTQPTD